MNILKLPPVVNAGADNTQTRSISVSLPPSEGSVVTGSLKVVENQMPPPLSMVLEELSGSEERRGSSSSVAPGSIPTFNEVKGGDSHYVASQMVYNPPKNSSCGFNLDGENNGEVEKCGSNVRSAGIDSVDKGSPKPPSSEMNEPKPKIYMVVEKSDCVDSKLSIQNNIEEQAGVTTQPVKKTVFTLLSQIDAVSSRMKNDCGNSALQSSSVCEGDLTKKSGIVPEPGETSTPVRLLSCRLQSSDGSDIRPLNSGNARDQECTSQLSPSRVRKVASVCQPSMTILHSSKQSTE